MQLPIRATPPYLIQVFLVESPSSLVVLSKSQSLFILVAKT